LLVPAKINAIVNIAKNKICFFIFLIFGAFPGHLPLSRWCKENSVNKFVFLAASIICNLAVSRFFASVALQPPHPPKGGLEEQNLLLLLGFLFKKVPGASCISRPWRNMSLRFNGLLFQAGNGSNAGSFFYAGLPAKKRSVFVFQNVKL